MLTLGIDDAGRGPVIGPMVLAGCLLDENAEKELKKLGVKDSKQLTQKRREVLETKIKDISEMYEIIIVPPSEIDIHTDQNKLNELEAIAASKIINRINKGYGKIRVVVDCPSIGIDKWRDFLKTRILDLSNLEIVCEHKADQNHVSVSAASILAKCTREKEMEKLKKIYGNEMGSGYPSDPSTKKFLVKNVHKHKDSGIFRKSWATYKNAAGPQVQKKLKEF